MLKFYKCRVRKCLAKILQKYYILYFQIVAVIRNHVLLFPKKRGKVYAIKPSSVHC